ncbi:MAG TPA: ABC transporter transmembrane domain-containing protein [Caulobacteraceae bacterium]|nr:ABC transporter transmembrane domain-containing protein [Caulobacteraceae bacterium]
MTTEGVVAAGRPGAGEVLAAQMDAAAERRERRRDLRPLASLVPFIAAHWKDAAASAFFLLFSSAASLVLPLILRLLIDQGIAAHTAGALDHYFLIAAADAAVLAVATAGRFFFITRLGERVVADLRQALYRHVMGLDQAFFLTTRTGEVLSRLTTDMTIVENMVGSSISVALRNLFTFVGAFAWLIWLSPGYTGLVVLVGVVVIAPLFVVGRIVRRLSASAQERFADAVAYAGETLDGLDTVQAFGREQSASRRFAAAVEAAFRASVARITARAVMTALVMVLLFGGIGFVLWRAALDSFVAHDPHMTGGILLQFVLLAVFAGGSVGALGETWGDVQKTSGAMERISEILDARPAIAAPPSPKPLPTPARGEVAFEDVSFAYPGRPDLPALSGFSLAVKPGERVALVGPSGAGKSTVFRLLLRFYDPQSGVVRLDGVNLTDADPAQVRARMALVAQDASLFSGSALDNLRFGREEASVDELRAAAKAAEAEGFLEALPQGFETPLGERAKTLSGGQRQRLAIARALVRGAPILLLDEATSALDAENERLVQRALADAMVGRTTLVIAHRLATVLAADRIVVMDAGQVVEEGTHTELIARGGLYARLAKLQFGLQAA